MGKSPPALLAYVTFDLSAVAMTQSDICRNVTIPITRGYIGLPRLADIFTNKGIFWYEVVFPKHNSYDLLNEGPRGSRITTSTPWAMEFQLIVTLELFLLKQFITVLRLAG